MSSVSSSVEAGTLNGTVFAVQMSADEGDERCQFILGVWLLLGNGVEQDTEAGTRWVHTAAKAGLPIAQSHLGLLYASGHGVERDERAAAQGIEEARVHLPAIESAMTASELRRAKAKAAEFDPRPIPKKRWLDPREVRLAFGPQTEYTRHFGWSPP